MAKRTTRNPEPKFKPTGGYTPMTEAELEAASQISEEDKAAARAMWRRHATPKVKRLLDAKGKKR